MGCNWSCLGYLVFEGGLLGGTSLYTGGKMKSKVVEVAVIGEEGVYEVEAIVASRKVGRKKKKTEYQVKWLG